MVFCPVQCNLVRADIANKWKICWHSREAFGDAALLPGHTNSSIHKVKKQKVLAIYKEGFLCSLRKKALLEGLYLFWHFNPVCVNFEIHCLFESIRYVLQWWPDSSRRCMCVVKADTINVMQNILPGLFPKTYITILTSQSELYFKLS